MEPKFQTSFIPKKPIVETPGSRASIVRSSNIFAVLATVIFLVALIVSGALFLYKNVLSGQVSKALKDISTARAAFQPEKIQELVDANSRISATAGLLEKHVLVSKVLLLMEELTLKKMRFKEFVYTNKSGVPTLTLNGEVQTYNALAQQQDIFLQNQFVKNPTFSNLNLGDNGYISVNFSTTLDPSLISYKKSVESIPIN